MFVYRYRFVDIFQYIHVSIHYNVHIYIQMYDYAIVILPLVLQDHQTVAHCLYRAHNSQRQTHHHFDDKPYILPDLLVLPRHQNKTYYSPTYP